MNWSVHVGRLAGIELRVHLTFPLLVVWLAASTFIGTDSWVQAGLMAGLVMAVFAIVVLHELGHALAARRFGIATKDITLLPIGGVARLEEMPKEPRQELIVALAGPAVNVGLAIIFGLLAFLHGDDLLGRSLAGTLSLDGLLVELTWINIALALFNLTPAFPMDGGRVLRAWLARTRPRVHATRIAATVGRGFALLMGLVGLLSNPVLVLVAVFVWVGAGAEAQQTWAEARMDGVQVRSATVREVHALSPTQPIGVAVRFVLDGFHTAFPVVMAGRVVGILTTESMLRALSEGGAAVAVGEAMETDFASVRPTDPLVVAIKAVSEHECRTGAVVDGLGQLHGLLTPDNIAELLAVEEAVEHADQIERAARSGVRLRARGPGGGDTSRGRAA